MASANYSQSSKLSGFFHGKAFPGVRGTVEKIEKQGDERVIVSSHGERLKLDKAALMKAFNQRLAAESRLKTIQSIRTGPNNRPLVKFGASPAIRTFMTRPMAEADINKKYQRAILGTKPK